MYKIFEGQTAEAVWLKVIAALRSNSQIQDSRTGSTRELLHAAISIEEPRQRWIASREPAINIAFALAEIVWIIMGRNDAAFLTYFNRGLPQYAGHSSTFDGAYGFRLKYHFGFNQLERAAQALRANPDSRQVVLQLWDARTDFPDSQGKARSPDIPCNITSMLKVRDNRLEWTQIMRSNDVFRGLPYNIVQFTTLQEVLAGWLRLEIGNYNHFADSLHLYEGDEQLAHATLPSLPFHQNEDNLMLPESESLHTFNKLNGCIEQIIDPKVADKVVSHMPEQSKLSPPYTNILCVLCAEGLRRRSRLDLSNQIMLDCSNPVYQQLWSRWSSRFIRTST